MIPQDVAKVILVARAWLENDPPFRTGPLGSDPVRFSVSRDDWGFHVVAFTKTLTLRESIFIDKSGHVIAADNP